MTEPAGPADTDLDIRLRSVRPLRGPSLWSTHPVAACEVEVGAPLADQPPAALSGFAGRLAAALPGLPPAPDTPGQPAPAAWAELVGRVSVALQGLVGAPVSFVRVIAGVAGDLPQLAVG
ncbi:MAG TPA: hypothetical protein VF541_15135, partial [Longimicrobium sp.]